MFKDKLVLKKLLLSICINFNNRAFITQNFNNIIRLWLAIMWPFSITLFLFTYCLKARKMDID